MPERNGAYFLVAVGHYGSESVSVEFSARSDRPDKQLAELRHLAAGIKLLIDDREAALLAAAPRVELAGG